MAIYFFKEETSFLLPDKTKYKNWIKKVAVKESRIVGKVNIVFASDEYVLKINREFLHHDFFTDVITFDDCEGNVLNGDIFISLDTVRSNGVLYENSFINELQRVIIHGILHLIGYDDETDENKIVIRNKENLYLECLYTDFLAKDPGKQN